MANLTDGVESIKQLTLGAIMEGTISNVTNFGAFVDIGVHQDGLVHISALSHQYVKDPHDLVKAGEIVKVKVMQIDVVRKRIGLTMRLSDELPTHDAPSFSSRPFPSQGASKSLTKRATQCPVTKAFGQYGAKIKGCSSTGKKVIATQNLNPN